MVGGDRLVVEGEFPPETSAFLGAAVGSRRTSTVEVSLFVVAHEKEYWGVSA